MIKVSRVETSNWHQFLDQMKAAVPYPEFFNLEFKA